MPQQKSHYRRKYFILQWHVTAKCSNRCAHCYMHCSEEYYSEIVNELSIDDGLRVLDDFHRMIASWNVLGRVNFTGGDPLLKPGILELIKYANEKNMMIGILGNPELLDYKMAIKLKRSGVMHYQLSIDGMEETHDRLRSRGSFRRTLKAIKLLNQVGISSGVMFTLSKQNADELIPVIRLIARKKVAIFDFARLVPMGAGVQFQDEMLKPKEFRNLLLDVLEEYKLLKDGGCNTLFGRKEYLWKLLYQELGLLKPISKDKKIVFSGCSIGISILTILANGTVYSCRRLPIKIGKVPEESLGYIFMQSPKHNELRKIERMEKCSKCELFQYCRGCPSVAFAVSAGNYFAPDPQCWKEIKLNKLRKEV